MKKPNLLIGIITVIIGLIMLFAPNAWTSAVVIILGVCAVINGLYNVFYVRNLISDIKYKRSILIRGILSIIIGLVAIILPLAVATAVWTVLLYILASYLIVSTMLEIYAVVKLKSFGENTKPYIAEIIGSLLLAVILFIIPAQFGTLIIRICGGILVAAGIGIAIWNLKYKTN
ncbi:MAG: DUF308 domain-containing protein [Spirochaetaceae bacterium]|nr:DUF308 domain-containing protein [Spirochaetaceae bacterium]